VALTDGNVYSWGANDDGELEIGICGHSSATLNLVKFPSSDIKISKIAAGYVSAAISEDGNLYTYGGMEPAV
jgi:alpha-tubulin suppressor-like RCC1 family protein